MSRWTLLLVFVAACTGTSHTRTGYASETVYHQQLADCENHVDCATLCIELFQLDTTATVDRVKIITHDQYGAKIACEFEGATDDWSADVGWDDWGGDECDGDCGDDGGWDDPGDDGTDDGSDDSGSDSGSDDPNPDPSSLHSPMHTIRSS